MGLEDEIYEAAAKAAPPGADEQNLRKLCRAAEAQLRARLKEDVRAEEIREVFVCAAGYLALGLMMTRAQTIAGSMESFTVGDVSVRTGGTTAALTPANGYLSRVETLMRPFVKSSGFAFLGVRG